jgi:hypothetical protein
MLFVHSEMKVVLYDLTFHLGYQCDTRFVTEVLLQVSVTVYHRIRDCD